MSRRYPSVAARLLTALIVMAVLAAAATVVIYIVLPLIGFVISLSLGLVAVVVSSLVVAVPVLILLGLFKDGDRHDDEQS